MTAVDSPHGLSQPAGRDWYVLKFSNFLHHSWSEWTRNSKEVRLDIKPEGPLVFSQEMVIVFLPCP